MNAKPLVLLILDGFGISLDKANNPVSEARKPILDNLEQNFLFTTLQASGTAVGLPWGEPGNSEVGHLTIGAGRVVYHHLPKIINAIANGSFYKNESLLKAAAHVKENNSSLHIAGVMSSGSVHGYINHLYALLEFTKKEDLSRIYLHIFSDGKDAPPREGVFFLAGLQEKIKKEWPRVTISSVIGRHYALDRDNHWDRIQTTYNLLTRGEGDRINSIPDYLDSSYRQDITDEFIKPAAVSDPDGTLVGIIKENDAVIFSDFREDSMRELTRAFTEENFQQFPREIPANLLVLTMTEYQEGTKAIPIFPRNEIRWPLGRVLSEAGLKQLRIAETQKYAHATYFLNGGQEEPFQGEDRILIPSMNDASQKTVQTIADNLDKYDVIIANLAGADLTGHGGNFKAGVETVEKIDQALGDIKEAVLQKNGILVITGDHGNIENKINLLSGERHTEHSSNPVYFMLIGKDFALPRPKTPAEVLAAKKRVEGIITDIAPTILELLGIRKPNDMTGRGLLDKLQEQ